MKALKSPLLLAFPALLLLVHDTGSQDPGLYIRFFVGALFAAVLLITARKELDGSVVSSPLGLILLAFALWPLSGLSAATAKSEIYIHMARMLFLYGTAVAVSSQISKDALQARAALALGAQLALAVGVLSLLPSFAEFLRGEADVYQVHGPLFTHKNFASASLLLLLPFALWSSDEARWQLGLKWGSVALALVLLLLLRTRGVWLAAFAMGLTAAVMLFRQKTNAKSTRLAMGATGGFVALAAAVGLFGASGQVFNSGTIQYRFHYWKAAWSMFTEHPIAGVGAGHWKIYYPSYGLAGTDEGVMTGMTNIVRPHNDLMWVLSELGVVGAVLFVALLLLTAWTLLRSKDHWPYALVLVGFAVYGLGEFPLERPTLLLPLAVVLGAALGVQRAVFKVPTGAALGLALAALLSSAYLSYERVQGERQAKVAVDGYLTKNVRAMIGGAKSAQTTYFELDIYATPPQYFEALGALMQMNGSKQPDPKVLAQAEALLKDGLAHHPYHLTTLNQLGDVYKYGKRYDEAAAQYETVVKLSPRHYQATLNLVEVRLAQNQVEEALVYLNKVSPKLTPQQYPKLGQVGASALLAYKRQGAQSPKFPGLLEQLQRAKGPEQAWNVWVRWRTKKKQ